MLNRSPPRTPAAFHGGWLASGQLRWVCALVLQASAHATIAPDFQDNYEANPVVLRYRIEPAAIPLGQHFKLIYERPVIFGRRPLAASKSCGLYFAFAVRPRLLLESFTLTPFEILAVRQDDPPMFK